jgi:hypothetical protein
VSALSALRTVRKVNISTRLDPALIVRLDRAAVAMAERSGGADITRSDSARVAIERGIGEIERELGIVSEEHAKPTPKGGKAPRKAK